MILENILTLIKVCVFYMFKFGEENLWESDEDFTYRLIWAVQNCPVNRQDWCFEDWFGNSDHFIDEQFFIKSKKLFEALKERKEGLTDL